MRMWWIVVIVLLTLSQIVWGVGECLTEEACRAKNIICEFQCSGDTDCLSNCESEFQTCASCEESSCFDSIDNDGDNLEDCEDPDCAATVSYFPAQHEFQKICDYQLAPILRHTHYFCDQTLLGKISMIYGDTSDPIFDVICVNNSEKYDFFECNTDQDDEGKGEIRRKISGEKIINGTCQFLCQGTEEQWFGCNCGQENRKVSVGQSKGTFRCTANGWVDDTLNITSDHGDLETNCNDGRDNDNNGATDCADYNCDGLNNCTYSGETKCADGIDNDGPETDEVWAAGKSFWKKNDNSWMSLEYSGNDGKTRNSIWIKDNFLVAVGDNQLILISRNRGKTWTYILYPEQQDPHLYDVWGSSANDLWAVGGRGTILHSTDQGQTWTPVESGTTKPLYAIWGTAPNRIWAVGGTLGTERQLGQVPYDLAIHGNVVLFYNGTEWVKENDGQYKAPFDDVWGISSENLWAISKEGTSLWKRTMTGGWQRTPIPEPELWGLFSIYGASASEFWITHWNKLLVTKDGGNNWKTYEIDDANTLRKVWGSSPNDIWATVGGGMGNAKGNLFGQILHFKDGQFTISYNNSEPKSAIFGTTIPKIDCQDSDCTKRPGPGGNKCCFTTADCGNNAGGAICQANFECEEISCSDNLDNDGDGATLKDCADPDCNRQPCGTNGICLDKKCVEKIGPSAAPGQTSKIAALPYQQLFNFQFSLITQTGDCREICKKMQKKSWFGQGIGDKCTCVGVR